MIKLEKETAFHRESLLFDPRHTSKAVFAKRQCSVSTKVVMFIQRSLRELQYQAKL